MPELRTRITEEVDAALDEARGGMTRLLRRRQKKGEAIGVLLFVYDQVRREGRLPEIIARYHPSAPGIDFR